MSKITELLSTATCSNQPPASLTLEQLLNAAAQIPKPTVPGDCFCGIDAYKLIQKDIHILAGRTYSGIRFSLDADLPPDVCEFRWPDGRVEERIEFPKK